MSAPPISQSAPPPAPPSPPLWTPAPIVVPAAAPREPVPWKTLAFWAEAGGFLLVLVGTIVAAAGTYAYATCSSSGTTCPYGYAGGLVAAQVLWALGLFGIGAAGGIKAHWLQSDIRTITPDDRAFFLHQRMWNVVQAIVALVLLAFIAAPLVK